MAKQIQELTPGHVIVVELDTGEILSEHATVAEARAALG